MSGYTVPTNEPKEFRTGDLLTWKRKDLTDYPASSWTLKYYLVKDGEQIIITAAADPDSTDNFLVSVAPATTATYTTGIYKWMARISTGSGVTLQEYTIEEGTIEILPNLGATLNTGLDTRSHAKKMLDAIEATLEGRATTYQLDLIEKVIGSDSMSKKPELLREWRDKYRIEYNLSLRKERVKRGKKGGGKTLMRLS